MRISATVLGFALVVLAAPTAPAADQPVFGKLLKVKNNLDPTRRAVVYFAKEPGSGSTVEGDPLNGGATLEVVIQPGLPGDTVSQQCFTLPASGWSTISSLGYKYKDAGGVNGPVRTAFIKRTSSGTFLLKVALSGKLGAITVHGLNHAAEGDAFFHIPGGDRYCSTFGGTIDPNGVSQFLGKNAPAPGACATPPLVCSPSGAFLDGAAGALF